MRSARAFTLVELLLSMTVLSILLVLVTNVVSVIQKGWSRTNSRTSQFREARSALDAIARNLSQATLNTYWEEDYNPLGQDILGQKRTAAKSFVRMSELQFICGPTPGLFLAGANAADYPGHGVFFQAPLGVTSLVTVNEGQLVNTENMVNLLCGRGYFVKWGDDAAFRPSFLNAVSRVPVRRRFRLMEYSPTAEMNQIYYDPENPSLTDLSKRRPITQRSKLWFQEVMSQGSQSSEAVNGQNAQTRAFTRPMADNVIALIISPQLDSRSAFPTSIAPSYSYDSTLLDNRAPNRITGVQVTQHLLPPLLKITLVALDSASGEKLAEQGMTNTRDSILARLAGSFTSPGDYVSVNSSYHTDLEALEKELVDNKLNYRVFTTTIVMKQAQWGGSPSVDP